MSRRPTLRSKTPPADTRVHWVALAVSTLCLVPVVSPNLAVAMNQRWLVSSAAYAVTFVVGIAAAAIACRERATRPLGALAGVLWLTLLCPWIVLGLSSLNIALPRPAQTVAFLWPSRVFFGSTLVYASPERAVLPEAWAGVITLGFWMVVAFGFARVAPRRASIAFVVVFAAVTVVATAWFVQAVVPLWGWKVLVS